MEKHTSKRATFLVVLLLLFGAVACSSLLFSFFTLMERNASNKLLNMMLIAKPGVKLDDVRKQLGIPMWEFHKLEDVIEFGPIDNEQFCKGKSLYSFYAVSPPCRAIDVYTDANGVIIYTTWHGL